MYCVFHHISGHLPRQICFWKISTKTWASVPPLLGQMPNFFRKWILRAPLRYLCQTQSFPSFGRHSASFLELVNILHWYCYAIARLKNQHIHNLLSTSIRGSSGVSSYLRPVHPSSLGDKKTHKSNVTNSRKIFILCEVMCWGDVLGVPGSPAGDGELLLQLPRLLLHLIPFQDCPL